MTADRSAPIRPTPERIAKGGIIENKEDRGGRPKPWSSFEAVQDGLLAAGLISKKGWEAAGLFRETYERANGSGIAATSFDRGVDNASRDVSERQAQAKLRLTRWSHDLAPVLFASLEATLGLGKAPSTWARDANHHPACGRVVLVAAIEQFAILHG